MATIAILINYIRAESTLVRKWLPLMMFIEIIVAALFAVEVFLVSVDTLYSTAWFGKIFMQVVSIAFIVFWSLAYKLYFDYNEDNLPP